MTAALAKDATRFDFFQALRLIECANPDSPRLGKARRAAQEPVRLRQRPHMSFPASSIAAFEPGAALGRDRLDVLLFGLFGPNGPLPLHLTVHAIERARHFDDPTFIDFCAMLQHRAITLFYRAYADARPAPMGDRSRAGRGDDDRFRRYLLSLCGLGLPGQQNRDALPDIFKAHHAGHLGQQARHPDGLAAMLRSLLGEPIAIEEFTGGWLELPESIRCRLGTDPSTGVLGMSAVVGSRSWQCQHRFTIVVGPLDLATYRGLLPGGDGLRRVAALVRNYLGEEFDWLLRLVLAAGEIPPLVLDGAARLGWTAWLPASGGRGDSDDLVLSPALAALRAGGVPQAQAKR